MRKVFGIFTVLFLSLILLTSCLADFIDLILPHKSYANIHNPTNSTIVVKCNYFIDSDSITVEPFSYEYVEIKLYDDQETIKFFTSGKYYSHVSEAVTVYDGDFFTYTPEPNVSVLKVFNNTSVDLDFVRFSRSNSSISGSIDNFFYYDEDGHYTGDSTIPSGEAKCILCMKDNGQCNITGWIKCSALNRNFITDHTVITPVAGKETYEYLSDFNLITNN